MLPSIGARHHESHRHEFKVSRESVLRIVFPVSLGEADRMVQVTAQSVAAIPHLSCEVSRVHRPS